MDPRNLTDWLALHLLPGLGPVTARRALERFQDPATVAYRLPANELARLGPVRAERIADGRKGLGQRAEREAKLCARNGIRVVTRSDPAYPAALLEIPSPPLLLYQLGELPPGVSRLAVVGSRTPTLYGRRLASGLAGGLALREIEVVSGGARGIDSLAHRAVLTASGRTIAVLGSGLLRPYPPENEPLFREIGQHGAVLSEFPLEERPRPENFPRRNRIISGLSAAVVVVEAAARSGSLGTAAHALEQGREVLAVPGPVHSLKSEGCHKLIQDGAKLVQNIEDIVEELSPLYRSAIPSGPADEDGPGLSGLSPDEEAVLRIVRDTEPVHLDLLADRASFGIARLHAALFGLELRGAVEQTPGRYYVLRPLKEP